MSNQNAASKSTASYGCWDSPLTAQLIFAARQTPSHPLPWREGVLFLLTMPEEGNAFALMFTDLAGKATRISPVGMNVRTRVHEYGGLAYACSDDQIFYCNFADQEIYRQQYTVDQNKFTEPVQITESAGDKVRYADILFDQRRKRLICVREDHRSSGGKASEVHNTLVSIELDDTQLPVKPEAQQVLFSQSDFIAGPSLSPDASRLGFITWSHPNMPWDNTDIRCARFNPQGGFEDCVCIDQGQLASNLQPSFDAENNLYFLSDRSNYWNLVRMDASAMEAGCVSTVVYGIAADCCGAPWELGKRNYAIGDRDRFFISVVKECSWQLHQVDLACGSVTVLEAGLGAIDQLHLTDGERLTYSAAGKNDYPGIFHRNVIPGGNTVTCVYRSALPHELSAELVSLPHHFQFRSVGGADAYGLLYLPRNPNFQAKGEELPPLLVNVHGGPTGTARSALNPMHQFWTSRGFAVLDLNHRGSTGYGRNFRQQLYQRWGVADIEDVVQAVRYLIDSKQVDEKRIAIRGGSAGGYAVLASLAASDLFAAGVSYYGIGDLELLARDTHKFESRYLDQLIGPYPESRERYAARSPINQLDKIRAPVLILQGTDDRVVPLNQAENLYTRLKVANPATEFVLFEGEGHGFRKPMNQISALETELHFYQRNLLAQFTH